MILLKELATQREPAVRGGLPIHREDVVLNGRDADSLKATAQDLRGRFGVNVIEHWQDVWRQYEQEGLLQVQGHEVLLTRAGLLRADALLPAFFEPEHQGVRYT